MQAIVLGERDSGSEDGGGIAVGDGGQRISALHGEIEESKHESNGDSEGFGGEEERGGCCKYNFEH